LVEMETVGAKLQGHALTQGISPLDDRAGTVELQTSRFARTELPFCIMANENDERGTRTVNARTIRRMIETHFMFEL